MSTPPLPIARGQARAQGLKTYTAGLTCRRHAGAPRLTSNGKCTGCIAHEKATLKAMTARLKDRMVAAAKAQALREIARDANAKAREAERARVKAEKAALKEAKENQARAAKARATREAKKAALAAQLIAPSDSTPATAADDLPPWA